MSCKNFHLYIIFNWSIHSDPVIMPAVSASGRIAALSFVRTAVAADQNTAEWICETGILFGTSHGRHELGLLRFNGSAKLARTRSGYVGASFLVRSVDRVSR